MGKNWLFIRDFQSILIVFCNSVWPKKSDKSHRFNGPETSMPIQSSHKVEPVVSSRERVKGWFVVSRSSGLRYFSANCQGKPESWQHSVSPLGCIISSPRSSRPRKFWACKTQTSATILKVGFLTP